LKYNVTTATIVIAFENIVLSGREQEGRNMKDESQTESPITTYAQHFPQKIIAKLETLTGLFPLFIKKNFRQSKVSD